VIEFKAMFCDAVYLSPNDTGLEVHSKDGSFKVENEMKSDKIKTLGFTDEENWITME
jgi:hypothetical protein